VAEERAFPLLLAQAERDGAGLRVLERLGDTEQLGRFERLAVG